MFNETFSAAAGAHEGDCCCEDTAAALTGLDGSSDERAAVTDSFDVVEDWKFCVSGEDKVAVHAMDCVFFGWDGELSS